MQNHIQVQWVCSRERKIVLYKQSSINQKPLDAIFWGSAEPLVAVLGGSAEPLSVSEEHLADSHRTRASADTVLDFPEEAWVLVNTDPGLPDECMLDSVVLSGRSENTQINEVWHWTDLDSLLVEAATA